MTDPNLVRFLGKQVRSDDSVGLIPYEVVRRGPEAVRRALEKLTLQGRRFAVVDALTDAHLLDIGEASAELKLITGGSGVAMGLPANYRKARLLPIACGLAQIPVLKGSAAVIAGSCSSATRCQVRRMAQDHPSFRVDPLDLIDDQPVVERAVEWALGEMDRGPVLIYSTDAPEAVANAQAHLGPERTGKIVEEALAGIARGLYDAGVKKWIVAGGETSGAVVEALGIKSLRIGPKPFAVVGDLGAGRRARQAIDQIGSNAKGVDHPSLGDSRMDVHPANRDDGQLGRKTSPRRSCPSLGHPTCSQPRRKVAPAGGGRRRGRFPHRT